MTDNLYIREEYINRTENYCIGDSDVFETFTNSKGVLYKALQKQHGRCVSNIFIDKLNGKSQKIGWLFLKKVKYEDSKDYYLQETWVTLHTAPAIRTVNYQYCEL